MVFGLSRRFTSLVVFLGTITATISGASGQLLWDPNMENGLKLFYSGDLRKSMPLLRKQAQDHPFDSTSAYLYAVSLHRLGYKAQATHEYEQILQKFPNTDASRLSQTGLRVLAPAYLNQWLRLHPSSGYEAVARPWNLAPDWNSNQELASSDTWIFDKRGTQMVVDGLVYNSGMRVIIDPRAEYTSVGRNTLRAIGSPAVNYGGGKADTVMKTVVQVGTIHRYAFPVHLVSNQSMPIIGRDFLRGFAYRIDSPHGKIYLVRKSDAAPDDIASHGPNMYAIKPGGGGGNVEGPGTAAQPWTEISVNKVGNLFIVSAYVDGSQVAMQLGSESGCVFSANQISGINSDYVNGGNQQQALNGQMVTTTSSVNLKSVRLGPITVTNFPAQIVDYSNARFQAFQWVTSEYPVLGSYIWDGWEHIIDEKKMVIRVRKIPTQ